MALRVWSVVCIIALVGSVLLVGCPKKTPPEPAINQPPVELPQPPVEEQTAEEPTTPEPGEKPAEFTWNEWPEVSQIPDGPLTGMMRGKPFEAKTVRIEKKDEDTWQMQITNGVLPDPQKVTGVISKDDAWRCRFTIAEGTTTSIERPIEDGKTFDDEHVYYYYDQGDDKPSMSVNGPWGMAIQITDWTVEQPSGDSKVIGTMKGRIALVMKDTEKSWVAGEFEGPVYQW